MELGPPWDAVFSLAWEAFVHGSTPIGAVVVDADGHTVASGRGRRLDVDPSPGQLNGCRIAHAELNALARLPMGASYGDHSLYASVEPCCLCMGAAIQTGVGRVLYAFDDPYAGAAHCMSVRNPQSARRVMTVQTALGGVPGRLSALLLLVHHRFHRSPLPHVTEAWERAEPDIANMAAGPIGDLVAASGKDKIGLEDLCQRVESSSPGFVTQT